jgi:hypothetical protein
MLVGVVSGIVGSWWTRRKARQAAANLAAQLSPQALGKRAVDALGRTATEGAGPRVDAVRQQARHRITTGAAQLRGRLPGGTN